MGAVIAMRMRVAAPDGGVATVPIQEYHRCRCGRLWACAGCHGGRTRECDQCFAARLDGRIRDLFAWMDDDAAGV